jgi:hypothetical protein
MRYRSLDGPSEPQRSGYPASGRMKAFSDIGGESGLVPDPALSLEVESIVRPQGSLVLARVMFVNPPVQGVVKLRPAPLT